MSDPALGYGKVIRFSSQGNYDVKCMAPAGAPFVKQSKDQLLITLWLTGEDPPQRIMLRTEHDNEEMSVPMHKQRSQPQLGVTAWRAAIDLQRTTPAALQFQTAVARSPALVYTAGLQPNAAGTTGAVCRRCTGYRPTMGCGSDFYQIFLIVLRVVFLVKLNRIMSITIMQPDKRSSCVTGMNRSRRRRADQRSMAAIWTG